jgi:hypothetical protein
VQEGSQKGLEGHHPAMLCGTHPERDDRLCLSLSRDIQTVQFPPGFARADRQDTNAELRRLQGPCYAGRNGGAKRFCFRPVPCLK